MQVLVDVADQSIDKLRLQIWVLANKLAEVEGPVVERHDQLPEAVQAVPHVPCVALECGGRHITLIERRVDGVGRKFAPFECEKDTG